MNKMNKVEREVRNTIVEEIMSKMNRTERETVR